MVEKIGHVINVKFLRSFYLHSPNSNVKSCFTLMPFV
jgi:hypothetical protein